MSDFNKVELGAKLRLFLKRINLSQEDLSRETGIDKTIISKMIKGTVKVSSELVVYLHKKYGLNFNWFYAETGTMKIRDKEKEERRLVTDMTDLLALVGELSAKIDRQDAKLTKVFNDFYAYKNGQS